jgi:hypothetical protein
MAPIRTRIENEGTGGSVIVWHNYVVANSKSLLPMKLVQRIQIHLADNLPVNSIDCVREYLQASAPIEIGRHCINRCSTAAIGIRLNRTVIINKLILADLRQCDARVVSSLNQP